MAAAANPKKVAPHPVESPAREAFVLYVREWVERLGLSDWRVVVSEKPAARANMAEVFEMDYGARLATIRIGRDFGAIPVDDDSLEDTALHEVLHIMLKEIIELARDPHTAADTFASAEHRVIHLLVRALATQQ